ncbi:hypothetical protein [Neorhodopirellula pilleata]|uniref:Uncharacterized protein n=1 Tax=Neorhodopirellula pilleata TaxID=2714738 RepID=A0A5C6A2R6_9BACT|nr:hypothetical protein [Neorhodopirellula pilleata]TWT93548.1 hypothetical protein Pla100_40660 [Neorhodopirellula pilleata]
MYFAKDLVNAFLLSAAFAVGLMLFGCDRKETVLDVDTPDGGVSVERDIDDGSISVDVDE